ncbi:condensation domain-containing protein [Sphaerimonospora sp. CA-214678]|uniref:condensation domain-containing protein n=1 Tax=Sphaerimonospora sp. CA-214678 TaxID=3240029 RepID=UPI003D929316
MTGEGLRVRFRAEPDIGPMTWGQLHIWRPLKWFGDASAAFNLRRVVAVDDGAVPPRAVGDWLRHLVESHQVLRTHFVDDPDGVGQIVAAEGEYTVEVVEAGEADPAVVAEECARRLAAAPFLLDREWPVRLGLICRGDQVFAIALVASHVALDGWAIERLTDSASGLLHGEAVDFVTEWQPLRQAAYERSERGRRQAAKAIGFWRAGLGELPDEPQRSPNPVLGEPRVQRWAYRSDELALASMRLAKRTGTSSSAVLLTLAAAVLGILRGRSTVAMQLIAANRYTSRQRRLLAAAAQDGLFVFRTPETDLDSTVQAVYRQATEAYFHAQYDPDALGALKDEVNRSRRHPIDLSGYFNDARLGRDWQVPDLPGPPAPPAFIGGFDRHDMTFCLGLAQRGASCEVSLLADTALVPPGDIPRVLVGVETVLTTASHRQVEMRELPVLFGLADSTRDTSSESPTRNGNRS